MIKWVILGIIAYLLMAFITLVFGLYIDRKSGCSVEDTYSQFDEYIVTMICIWWIYLPICIVVFSTKYVKKLCIAIVETKIANEERKENRG